MGSQDSDEDLVALASQGRMDAFETLFSRHQDRVFNLLVRMCGSEEDAEDLAQKTFVNAWQALGSFRKGSRFYTWLYRIALNAAFTHERDRARKRRHEAGSLDATVAGGAGKEGESRETFGTSLRDPRSSDPLAELMNKERDAQIQDALAKIDADYRVILVLRDIDDLDYEAIADTLSITHAAVKSRLHRARKELARMLRDFE
ncbi:MAG TPA: sigma-70 family RNA polymerase sigma factor [Planctomycetota bacterium]|nr:sigma-70 family RNA polymerase sigma factor [Planctomycetota bacterium]